MNHIDNLREEFKEWEINGESRASMKEVADWWTDKLTSTLKEIEGKIAGEREKRDIYSPAYVSGFNEALDKAKSIINSYLQGK